MLNLSTSAFSASALAPFMACQNVTVTGPADFSTSAPGAVSEPPSSDDVDELPHAAVRASASAAAPAVNVLLKRNFIGCLSVMGTTAAASPDRAGGQATHQEPLAEG